MGFSDVHKRREHAIGVEIMKMNKPKRPVKDIPLPQVL